jgi:hypothetical protein
MLHLAGILFGNFGAYSYGITEKGSKEIVPLPNFRCPENPFLGKGYGTVPLVFQKTLLFQDLERGKYRRLGNPQPGSNIRNPDLTFIGEETHHFKIIFQ